MTKHEHELLIAAHQYAEQGLYVFPVDPKTELPLIDINRATTNHNLIDYFWRVSFRGASIAIRTGLVNAGGEVAS